MFLLYYLIIYPLSKLPLWWLYGIKPFLFFLLYRVIGYRRRVVQTNLKNSFPDKSQSELKKIEKDFFHYLSKLFIESIKNLTISDRKLLQRMKVKNPEVINQFYEQNRSVLLVGPHSHNWEYMITAQNILFKHQAVGIGMPLTSRFWNQKLNEKRQRFGMRVIHAKILEEKLQEWSHENLAILVLFDQSPSNPRKAYWHQFLNQQTAFLFGTEKMAVSKNFPVIQFYMKEPSKGHYEITLELITSTPRDEEYGMITKKMIANLERHILETPAHWLWSHKRWKRKVPEDLSDIQQKQKEQFIEWKKELLT